MAEKNNLTQEEETLRRKRTVRMALLANFFLMTAAMAAMGVAPKIYMELDTVVSGCPVEASSPEERLKCIASIAGGLIGKTTSLQALFCLLSAGALGMLSDTFGRKPFLIASAVGICLDFCGLLFATGGTPGGTTVICFVKALSGFMGNQDIFVKAALADASTPEEAPANFAAMATNLGLGLIVGSFGAEIMVAAFGTLKAGVVYGFVCSLISVALLVAMPEPLASKNKKPVQWALANPFGSMAFLFSKSYFTLFALMSLCEKTALSLCFSNLGIFCIVVFGEGTPFVLLLLFLGVGVGVVCGVLLPPSVRRIGTLDTIKLGLVVAFFAYLGVVIVTPFRQFKLMFVAFAVLCVGGMAAPCQASAVTLCAAAEEQGTLQGAIGSMEVMSRVLGPFAGAMIWKSSAMAGNFTYLWWGGAALMVPAIIAAFALPNVLPAELALRIRGGKEDRDA